MDDNTVLIRINKLADEELELEESHDEEVVEKYLQ
jgi:hypothetical protein